jgi:hypothetical protein
MDFPEKKKKMHLKLKVDALGLDENIYSKDTIEWTEKNTNLSQDCGYYNMENVTSQARV